MPKTFSTAYPNRFIFVNGFDTIKKNCKEKNSDNFFAIFGKNQYNYRRKKTIGKP